MTTLERPRQQNPTTTADGPRRSSRMAVIMALVAVLTLAIGGFAGWMIRGDGSSDIVLAGDGDLTARQEQMLDVVHDAERAWQAGDADAVLALFTPDGTFSALGTDYRADDGTLADYVERGNWTTLDVLEPMLVHGNEVFMFHEYGGQTYSETMTFTTSGDLLIVSHVIHS